MFKPPTVLSQGDNTGDDSLLDAAKRYLVHSQNKPGDAFLGTCCLDFLYDIALTGSSAITTTGMVHRLDRPCSGVMAFAKTSKAAMRLSEALRERDA
jgi:23S rRNA pseudouridine1911/1915/1917 synthase